MTRGTARSKTTNVHVTNIVLVPVTWLIELTDVYFVHYVIVLGGKHSIKM